MYHLWCFSIYFGNTVITKVHVVFVFTTFTSCKMGCCSASDTFSFEQSSSGRGGSFFTSDAVDGILMHCCDYTYPVDYLIWKTENEALFILLIWAILFFEIVTNNHCDHVDTFEVSSLILSGSLGLKFFLRNRFRSAVPFPKRAKASTSGFINSLLCSCRRLELIMLSEATVTT